MPEENLESCPRCGSQLEEGSVFCTSCGYSLGDTPGVTYTPPAADKRYTEHLFTGFNVAMRQPMVFIPSILGGLLGSLIGSRGLGLGIISGIVVFLFSFASIDMSRNAYSNRPLDLNESLRYVISRAVEFLIAAIVAGVLSVTFILIPVAILMIVVMVVDETGIGNAVSKSFKVIRSDLSDVILIILVSIVGSFIIGWVPLLSSLLTSMLNVIVGLAFIDMYVTYKRR